MLSKRLYPWTALGGYWQDGQGGGTGRPKAPRAPLAVAERWLEAAAGVAEETDAAARPVKTTSMARMRIRSFMTINSFLRIRRKLERIASLGPNGR